MQEDLDLDPPIFESLQPLHNYMAWTGELLHTHSTSILQGLVAETRAKDFPSRSELELLS